MGDKGPVAVDRYGIKPWLGSVFRRIRPGDWEDLPKLVKEILQFTAIMNTTSQAGLFSIVTYDIGSNKVRKLIGDFLLAKGFQRIQLSVYAGMFSSTQLKHISVDLAEVNAMYEKSYQTEAINQWESH